MNCLKKMEWNHLEQVEHKINKVIVLNMIVPIILGALIYYLMSPEVIFVKQIENFLEIKFRISDISMDNVFLRFVRNYFLDMLWGYALVFSLFLVNGNNTAELKRILVIAFVFSAIMEVLQITPFAKGTFDVYDVIVELLAEVMAVFIIKNFLLRRNFK